MKVLKQLGFISDPQVVQRSVSNQRTKPRQVFITAPPISQQSPKTPACPQKRQIVSNGHFDVVKYIHLCESLLVEKSLSRK